MTKIVYNSCYGGFSLSQIGWNHYCKLTGRDPKSSNQSRDIPRDDPALVQTILDLGHDTAAGGFASLTIRDLPPGTRYRIQEYDGMEWIELESEIEWSVA